VRLDDIVHRIEHRENRMIERHLYKLVIFKW